MSFQFSKWTVLPAAAVLLLGTVALGQDTSSTGTSTQSTTTTTAPAPKPTIAQKRQLKPRVICVMQLCAPAEVQPQRPGAQRRRPPRCVERWVGSAPQSRTLPMPGRPW